MLGDMQYIQLVIEDYLKGGQTDYALMLCGEWGCGKTYYVTNTLKGTIESIKVPLREEKYVCRFVSLYGIQSGADVTYRLYAAKYSKATNVATPLVSAVKAVSGFFQHPVEIGDEKQMSRWLEQFAIKENEVFIFDDVERIDEKLLPEVFAVFNQYVETHHAKVILVCNDSKMDCVSEYLEKTVRFKLRYEASISDTLLQILKDKKYNEEYTTFIKNYSNLIVEIFSILQCCNLRTLIFVLDNYLKIYNQIISCQYDESYNNLLFEENWKDLIVYSVAFKQGFSDWEIQQMEYTTPELMLGVETNPLEDVPNEKMPSDRDNEVKRAKVQFGKISWKYRKEIALLVMNGYLDLTEFKNHSERRIADWKKEANSEEQQFCLNLMRGWRQMEDDDIQPTLERGYKMLIGGKFNLYQIAMFFSVWMQLEGSNIDGCAMCSEQMCEFEKAINRAVANHTFDHRFEWCIPQWDPNEQGESAEKYRKIAKLACEANKNAKEHEYHEDAKSIITAIRERDKEQIVEIMKDTDNHYVEHVDIDELWDVLIAAPNSIKAAWCTMFAASNPTPGFGHYSKELVAQHRKLLGKMRKYLDEKPYRISSMWISYAYQSMSGKLVHSDAIEV